MLGRDGRAMLVVNLCRHLAERETVRLTGLPQRLPQTEPGSRYGP
jgi:hypothetical protein